MKKKWKWNSCDDEVEEKNESEVADDTSESLEHHGILGMKWGVRRTPEQLGHKTSSTKKTKVTVVKKSSYERKMEKLAAKEKKIAEKEAVKAKKDELKWRQAELHDASAKAKAKEEKAKAKEEKTKERVAEEKANKKTNSDASRNAKSLTDDELRAIINRYNLEKQYNQITKEQTQTGKSWVTDMLTSVGKEVAKEYTKKAVVHAINSAIEEAKKKQRGNSGGNSGSGSGSGGGSS